MKIKKNIKKIINEEKNKILLERFLKISKLIKKEKIPFIVLKGFSLTYLLKNPYSKDMADIDILIKPEDKYKLLKLLIKNNFTLTNRRSLIHLEEFERKYELKNYISLDIHWSFLPYPLNDLDINEVFKSKIKCNIGKVSFYSLNIEWTIIFLCLHTTLNHFFTIGKRDLDSIAKLTKIYNINWKFIITKSLKYKISDFIYLSLFLSKKYCNALIPEDVLKKIYTQLTFRDKIVLNILSKKNYTFKIKKYTFIEFLIIAIMLKSSFRVKLFKRAFSTLVLEKIRKVLNNENILSLF